MLNASAVTPTHFFFCRFSTRRAMLIAASPDFTTTVAFQ
jgi:hypothetical protein